MMSPVPTKNRPPIVTNGIKIAINAVNYRCDCA